MSGYKKGIHTGEVIGSEGAETLILDETAISNKTLDVALTGTENVLLEDSGLKKTTTQAIADLGGGINYLVYTALITQTSTNAPTVIVLENTLSDAIVWTYDNVGTYIGTLVAAFTVDKVFALTGGGFGLIGQNVTLVKSTNDTILLNSSSNSGTKTDGLLTKAYIEIRVYP